jgi:hypothetical protein
MELKNFLLNNTVAKKCQRKSALSLEKMVALAAQS